MLLVRTVTSAGDLKKFITIPWAIYADDPVWVPPLIREEKRILDTRRNPFFGHARACCFIAESDGRPLGRIAAVIDENSNRFHGERVGLFGFFECVNDTSVSNALLQAAADWVKNRGAAVLRGPIDLSTNERMGLLVDGFNRRPAVMMKYNPEYYVKLLEAFGLKKEKDVVSYEFLVERTGDRLQRLSAIADRRGYRARGLNMGDFRNELKRVREIYNEAWENNWGFVPMNETEFDFTAAGLKTIVIQQLGVIVEKDGAPVGFGLIVPDINEILGLANGRLFPLGWIRLMTAFRRIKGLRLILMGVKKNHRMRGVDALVLKQLLDGAIELGFERCDVGWILEDNEEATATILDLGGRQYRRYRVYCMSL